MAGVAVCALSTIFALNAVSGEQTKTATFSKIADAVPGKYYDPATTAPHPANANRLVIGLNGFVVSSKYPYSHTAMDTISFRVTAPSGFYISKLSYAHVGESRTSGEAER